MLKIRLFIVGIVAVIALVLGTSGVAFADATTQTVVTRTPVSETTTGLACVNEEVLITGYIQTTFHMTINATGGGTVVQTSSESNMQATGLTTDQVYRIVGSPFNNTIAFVGPSYTFTNVVTANVIGQGQPNSGPVFKITILEHVTINANGDVTSNISQYSEECL